MVAKAKKTASKKPASQSEARLYHCCDLPVSAKHVGTECLLETMIGGNLTLHVGNCGSKIDVLASVTNGHIGSGTRKVVLFIAADDWLDANRRVVEKIQSLKAKEKHGG
jgi:hypothetical protein